jgi:hypothetical protein
MKETFFSALDVVQTLSAILVFLIGIGILVVIVMYIVDVNQTEHAIRRNFPVIGRFRYLFESLGEYFRQYFFAQDPQPSRSAQRATSARSARWYSSIARTRCSKPTLHRHQRRLSVLTRASLMQPTRCSMYQR